MRSKLSLNLEDLSVESFDTTSGQKAKGTVFGEQCTCYTNCTCPGCPTCDASCDGTCGDTCPATCPYTCDDASCGGGCATLAYTNCWRCNQSFDASACNGMICP